MMNMEERRVCILGGLARPDRWMAHLEVLTAALARQGNAVLVVEDRPELRQVLERADLPVRWFRDLRQAREILGIPEQKESFPEERPDSGEARGAPEKALNLAEYERFSGKTFPEVFLGPVFYPEGVGLWEMVFVYAGAPDGREFLLLRGDRQVGMFLGLVQLFSHMLDDWNAVRGTFDQFPPVRVRATARMAIFLPLRGMEKVTPSVPEASTLPMVELTFRLAWQRVAAWMPGVIS